MQVLRKVPLLPATYDPRQRQRSAFVDHVDHQRYATPAHPTAIDDQHQRLESQLSQQDLGIRDKIAPRR